MKSLSKLLVMVALGMQLLPAHAQTCLPSTTVSCTANIGLARPYYNSDGWDVPLNGNFTALDQLLSGNANLSALSFNNGIISGSVTFPGNVTVLGQLTYPNQAQPAGSSTGSGATVLQASPQLFGASVQGGLSVDNLTVTKQLVLAGQTTILSTSTSNTDFVGIILLSGGSGSYTFKGTYSNSPTCILSDPAGNSFHYSISATQLSITSGTGSDQISYVCPGAVPAVLVPTTTYALQTGNNASSCTGTSPNFMPSYCTSALQALQTSSSNTGAQTTVLTPTGHVSQMKLSTYLYPGATTQFIAAYQPWFPGQSSCWTLPFSGSSAHPCTGYNENTASVVGAQHSAMIARGFSMVSPDWYGTSSTQSFINNTVKAEATDLAGRCNGSACPLKLLVMVDGGTITSGMSGISGCSKTASTDQTSCITSVLDAAWDYIDANWGRQNYYATDPSSGDPLTLTFITQSAWSSTACSTTCWTNVWANVKSHMNTYATPYKIIKEFGDFTTANIDGAYGWPMSEAYGSSAQLCWQGATCSFNYFQDLYEKAQASPSKILVGHLWAGFDGSNNNYNNNVTARQCGQLLYLEAQYLWSTGTGFTLYSSSNQLPYIIVPTWNDYGEGTNVENGIDNCYTVSASISTNTLNWTLNKTDTTYASTTTIDHFTLWYADTLGNLYLALDNIPVGTSSESLSSLVPSGTWTIYLEMVGKPLILNRMSNGVSYTH